MPRFAQPFHTCFGCENEAVNSTDSTRTQEPGSLQIRRPDDWHLHLRDGTALAAVLPFSARQFARAIVMPNLRPPVTTAAAAVAYRQRILDGG